MDNLEFLIQITKNYCGVIQDLSAKQLVAIPKGYKNNILWNLGHCLVVNELLINKLSGVEMMIGEQELALFGRDTSPSDWSDTPYDVIEKIVPSAIRIQENYESAIYQNYQDYKISPFGTTLTNVEDAIRFSCFHGGVHLGIIMSRIHLL